MPVVTLQKYAIRQWAEGPGAAQAARWVMGGCVLLIAHAAATLTWNLLPSPPPAVAPPAAPQVATTSASAANSSAVKDYTALTNLHLFGEYKAPAVEPTQTVEAPPPVETQLRLNLLGILYDDTPEHARAMIANEQGEEESYGVGAQVVPGAKIEEIHQDHIIISRGGKREILKLPEDKFAEGEYDPNPVNSNTYNSYSGGSDAGYAPPPPTDYNSGGQQYSPYGENPYNQNPTNGGRVANSGASPKPSITDGKSMRQLREELVQNPQKIGSLIRAAPVNKGNKFRGFRVSPGRDPKLFHQLGLKSGDIVTSVNGIALDHPSKGFQAMQQIATAASVAITVERKGQTKQFFVTMD